MKKFGEEEALDDAYASAKECEDMEPTHNVQSKAFTERSVEKKKYKILRISFPVLEDHDIGALANVGEQGQTHAEESPEKSFDLLHAL